MDERRTALAVLISVMVVMIYFQVVLAPRQRAAQPPAPVQTAPAAPAAAQQPAAPPPPPPGAPAQPTAAQVQPSAEELRAGPKLEIETPLVTVTITEIGGRISNYKLKEYKKQLGSDEPLDLILVGAGSPLPLGVTVGAVSDDAVHYRIGTVAGDFQQSGDKYVLSPGGQIILDMSGSLPDGTAVKKILTLKGDSYLFGVEVQLPNGPRDAAVWLNWVESVEQTPGDQHLDPITVSLLGDNNKVTILQPPKLAEGADNPASVTWASVGGKYFMAALIPPPQPGNASIVRQKNSLYARVRGTQPNSKFLLYVGPKDSGILKDTGYQLQRNIDLGIFTFLAYPLLLMIRVLYSVLGNYGLAIIVLTLIIKGLFLPLTGASMKSMKAMQDLQPEVQALRERIEDPQQLQQEIMGLYKKKGVNPMGGCLPILIQLPVFLGLYNALLNSIDLRHAPFALWITDLSTPERLDMLGVGVPVMIIIMGISMFVQQYTAPATGDPTQRRVMLLMPVIFTVMFIIFPFPSGLVLYWLVNNLISIVQQMYLKKEGSSSLVATVVASVAIFCFGYLLTLF